MPRKSQEKKRAQLTNCVQMIGVYTYRGTETPDGLPRIISDDLFYEVQDMMGKKKKPLRVQRLSKITY